MSKPTTLSEQSRLNLECYGITYYMDMLYSSLPGSLRYQEARQHIESWYRDTKSGANEQILVMRNYLVKNDGKLPLDFNPAILATHVDSKKLPASSIEYMEVLPRFVAEYNPQWLQLVSGVIIANEKGDRFAFLKTTKHEDNRIQEKMTLVQGHVTANHEIYTAPISKLIENAAKRELLEETNLTEMDLVDVDFRFTHVVHDVTNAVGFEHAGYIYKVNLKDESFNNLKSNEPEKHEIMFVDQQDVAYNVGRYGDRWLHDLLDASSFNTYHFTTATR